MEVFLLLYKEIGYEGRNSERQPKYQVLNIGNTRQGILFAQMWFFSLRIKIYLEKAN